MCRICILKNCQFAKLLLLLHKVVLWQSSCLEVGNFARTFYFKNASNLAPKNPLSFSNLVLPKVLCLKESDDYFCGTRRIKYLCNNLVPNKETVENLMGIYVT